MSALRRFSVGDVHLGEGLPLALIAGPCAAESERLVLEVAEALVGICARLELPLLFKASYEKDNRTAARAYGGPGRDAGLAALAAVKQRFGVPVLSDVHRIEDVEPAAEVLDVIQVPALLCRQTSLLQAIGACGRPVNLKKGQFGSPAAMGGAVDKLRLAGAEQVMLTERGNVFGYERMVADLPSIAALATLGCAVAFDAGHASNAPEEIPLLARAGVAAGADALFIECHPDPENALCDGRRMLSLDRVESLLREVQGICRALVADGPGAQS